MATIFHSNNSEVQAGCTDGLQTLVLMNPRYVQYSDTPPSPQPPQNHGGNFVLFNSAAAVAGNVSLSTQNLAHASPSHTQQFVGLPLSSEQSVHGHHHVSTLPAFLPPRLHYNNWNNAIDSNAVVREATRATQGLSLSLQDSISGEDARASGGTPSPASGARNAGVYHGSVLGPKYLKAAQELLDEVVNVYNGIKSETKRFDNKSNNAVGESSTVASGDGLVSGGDENGKRSCEISTTERQEIQMKKAKLVTMLDEVEQRYRQYHNQMQIVISSFEQAAGIGSARTYTSLALQTISKQFRSLKDAILGQIRAANKSLGEENCFGRKIEGSRLKYVDHHLRQQRAIQQLGMIHHNAWRPQRGLPERSVSILRAWLFEHFLHPYPKDSDKHMLAKQTGLTRSQVSNWFINARVRLWKPMVEEMYKEEMEEHELNGSDNKSCKTNDDDPARKTTTSQNKGHAIETEAKNCISKQEVSKNQSTSIISASTPSSTSPVGENVKNQSGFSFIGSSSELDGITQGSPKKPRNHEVLQSPINIDVKPIEANNDQLSMKFGDHRECREGYSFMGNQTDFIGGFGQYPIEEIGRFGAEQFTPRFSGNNGVSLTLGLPHCDILSGSHQSFLPSQNIQIGRRLDNIDEPNEFGSINITNPHTSATAFESINMQNPKRFVAQLLPDFVA